MMANLIFRKYLSQKDKVLALANSILEAHIGDTEETQDKEAILKSKQAELEKLSKKIDGTSKCGPRGISAGRPSA